MDEGRVVHKRLVGVAGIVAGALAGLATVLTTGTAIAHRLAPTPPAPVLEATHLPPLLTVPGEQVELRYDVFCSAPEDAPHAPCPAAGSVFVRSGSAGAFRELALEEDRSAAGGRLTADIPESIAGSASGFTYYAVLRNDATGDSVTLPAGGAATPQRSLPLDRPVHVALGAHTFGQPRSRNARVASAAWGSGRGQVGLEQGRNLTPIGGSAFDVSRNGVVHVLDEANRRVLRWTARGGRASSVPLAINGTLADMSVARDGTIHVLETTKRGTTSQLLRSFAPNGRAKAAAAVRERAAQVRLGPRDTPLVLQQPSGQWTPATRRLSTGANPRLTRRPGRLLPGGREVVVLRRGSEVRVSVIDRRGARCSWRITSQTPLAEVQLAEVHGSRLILVVRAYTDVSDEFVALQLSAAGLERRFALDSADWAETAPLSRFRVVGSSLYQLGSTPAGVFVDRFDLEVKR
jgi:hypothetical protein